MHGAFGFRRSCRCRVALDFRTCVLKTQVSRTRVLDAGTRVPRQLSFFPWVPFKRIPPEQRANM